MLQVSRLYARSFDLDHMDVMWEIADFSGDIYQFNFFVERSESAAGPWETLAGPFQDQYYFRDISPALLHKWRTLFYRLRIVDRQTNEEATFGPTAQQGEPDLIALEIQRQEDVLFREHVGRRCWLFPVRTFGAKCICFDRVTGRRTRSNCLTCYDTGYLGGFFSPIECFIQVDPNPNSPTQTPRGEQQNNNTSARLISFPPVKPKDILVEAENKRWRVETVTPTQRLRSVVHQELVLHEVPRDDIVFRLPIGIADLTKVEISAERNFSNPQHVDGENADLESVLAAYGYPIRGSV